MEQLKKFLLELQEISDIIWRSLKGLYKGPRYLNDIFRQMDLIGVGSLPIVILTGFFTGGVLILQAYPTYQYYGIQNQAGYSVATSLIRELGPVLAALMVSGRVGSSIAAELGSMVVSQQIEAMRALGTSPIRKLVTPRIIALVLMLPFLTVAADVFGIIGGGVIARGVFDHDPAQFVNSVKHGVVVSDILGGLIKPVVFGFIIGAVACYKGMQTEGGTAGVGVATTKAVVLASILVIIADFFVSKLFQGIFGIGLI